MEAVVEPRGQLLRDAREEIGPPDIAHEERATAEEPHRLGPARGIGDHIAAVLRRVAGSLDEPHREVVDLKGVTLGERDMVEPAVARAGRVDRGARAFREVQMPGGEIHVKMGLQDVGDPHAEVLGGVQVDYDMASRIHDCTLAGRPQQIGAVGDSPHEELSHKHAGTLPPSDSSTRVQVVAPWRGFPHSWG